MIKPQDIPFFEQTPLWLWPALWWQLRRLHTWLDNCAARLGEPVEAQYCAINGRVFLIRLSDNLSGAAKRSGWTGTGHKCVDHLVQPLGPCAPMFTLPAPPDTIAAARICAASGLFAPMPLRFLGPG